MKSPFILILIFNLTVIVGCDDIIERNISDVTVVVHSPPDSLISTLVTQVFWWNEVDGADYYNLQIVSPSFSYILQLVTDTNIYGTKFSYSLNPGNYEWRIKALNFAYETPFTTQMLIIDSTPDISHQVIRLLGPADLDTTNKTQFLFDWEKLYNAQNYHFQILYENQSYISEILSYDSITHFLNAGDGSYQWKIRGQNSTSNTPYSSRTLFIDTSSPGIPQLILPEANSALKDSIISFSWKRGEHYGSSVRDSLFIAKDSLFNNAVLSIIVNGTCYQDSLGKGNYFWRVSSSDKAGNWSGYSGSRKFSIVSIR